MDCHKRYAVSSINGPIKTTRTHAPVEKDLIPDIVNLSPSKSIRLVILDGNKA